MARGGLVLGSTHVEVVEFGPALHWPELGEDMGVNEPLGVSEEEIARLAGFTIYSSRP